MMDALMYLQKWGIAFFVSEVKKLAHTIHVWYIDQMNGGFLW